MPGFTLDKTLDTISTEYDYGIVPGSVAVFIRDSIENYGRFELTLLEGILLIIEAYEDGFMITHCTPLADTPAIKASLTQVQDQLEHKFDTMDKLLLTISPQFSQRYWEKTIQSNPSPILTGETKNDATVLAMDASPADNDIFEWLL